MGCFVYAQSTDMKLFNQYCDAKISASKQNRELIIAYAHALAN